MLSLGLHNRKTKNFGKAFYQIISRIKVGPGAAYKKV